jgi:hypothetical protein
MRIAPRLKGNSEASGASRRPCPQKQEAALDDSRPGKALMQLTLRTLSRITPGKHRWHGRSSILDSVSRFHDTGRHLGTDLHRASAT